ncbi:MAG: hypothetical protein FJX59_10375 [Alphaproteobacteria bacterium]|nr:hypothetical protein [Alphaproteobacteria bacterium]
MNRLTHVDLATMTGLPEAFARAHIPGEALGTMEWRRLTPSERDGAILGAIRENERDDLASAGPEGIARWEKGWAEVAARVANDGASEDTLRPQYFRYEFMRLLGDYARPEARDLEYRIHKMLSELVFRTHLAGLESIVEFACGTGINLMRIGKIFPTIKLTGCDWAKPSQDILGRIATQHGINLAGKLVNLWTGEGADPAALRHGRTGILTVHGLEQIGAGWGPFLKIVEAMKPAIVVHIEPIVEMYDPNSLLDALAICYHKKRKYVDGFLTEIRAREAAGQAEIVATKRFNFGSSFQEAYTLVVWRPKA